MTNVSRETPVAGRSAVLADLPEAIGRRLDVYVELLVRWQRTINLVAPSTLPDLWTRHIADSLQVAAAAPAARRWVDLGTGGGFPGLVTAIALAESADADIHLVESDKRKAAFLRTVARETGAPATIHAERIEAFVPAYDDIVDAVSARALAPLPHLVAMSEKFLLNGAVGIFPKGQTAASELTGFERSHRFEVESMPSRIERSASLLIVRAVRTVATDPESGRS
jgi:16S rRNA m(7)G-527 methyltransferase (EC 2.1.1.-)